MEVKVNHFSVKTLVWIRLNILYRDRVHRLACDDGLRLPEKSDQGSPQAKLQALWKKAVFQEIKWRKTLPTEGGFPQELKITAIV
ncbi:hypothetical protein ACROYT_G020763 [Oculina patagonica]